MCCIHDWMMESVRLIWDHLCVGPEHSVNMNVLVTLQAFVPGRLRVRSPGAHPQVQTAQRETAAAPEVSGQPEQLLHQHPAAVLPPRRPRWVCRGRVKPLDQTRIRMYWLSETLWIQVIVSLHQVYMTSPDDIIWIFAGTQTVSFIRRRVCLRRYSCLFIRLASRDADCFSVVVHRKINIFFLVGVKWSHLFVFSSILFFQRAPLRRRPLSLKAETLITSPTSGGSSSCRLSWLSAPCWATPSWPESCPSNTPSKRRWRRRRTWRPLNPTRRRRETAEETEVKLLHHGTLRTVQDEIQMCSQETRRDKKINIDNHQLSRTGSRCQRWFMYRNKLKDHLWFLYVESDSVSALFFFLNFSRKTQDFSPKSHFNNFFTLFC